MPQNKKENAQKLTDEQFEQVVLLVRDTIVESIQYGADKEVVDIYTDIFNVLTDNDKHNQLKPFLEKKEN